MYSLNLVVEITACIGNSIGEPGFNFGKYTSTHRRKESSAEALARARKPDNGDKIYSALSDDSYVLSQVIRQPTISAVSCVIIKYLGAHRKTCNILQLKTAHMLCLCMRARY